MSQMHWPARRRAVVASEHGSSQVVDFERSLSVRPPAARSERVPRERRFRSPGHDDRHADRSPRESNSELTLLGSAGRAQSWMMSPVGAMYQDPLGA